MGIWLNRCRFFIRFLNPRCSLGYIFDWSIDHGLCNQVSKGFIQKSSLHYLLEAVAIYGVIMAIILAGKIGQRPIEFPGTLGEAAIAKA